jgi:hypothetical protein
VGGWRIVILNKKEPCGYEGDLYMGPNPPLAPFILKAATATVI